MLTEACTQSCGLSSEEIHNINVLREYKISSISMGLNAQKMVKKAKVLHRELAFEMRFKQVNSLSIFTS